MNKFSFFLALAAFAVFFGCSDDKKAPTHSEICNETPLSRDCLVGKWNFTGVYYDYENGNKIPECSNSGSLEFKADGDYNFKGELSELNLELDLVGRWEFDGDTIIINDLDFGTSRGTVTVTSAGNNMEIKTREAESVFNRCNIGNNIAKVEKFIWRNNQ